jgi:glycosyltransferase involved in cell wall biosynthesis
VRDFFVVRPARFTYTGNHQRSSVHIGFLTGHLTRRSGGLYDSVRRLAQTLYEDGAIVDVLGLVDRFSIDDQPAWAPLRPQGFRVVGPATVGYAPRLYAGLTRSQAELVHCHGIWMYPALACLRLARRVHKPYLISPRGMLDPWALSHSGWKKRVAGFLFQNAHLHQAACIHALCDAEAEAVRAYGLSNPICIIPNGVDVPRSVENSNSGTGSLLSKFADDRKILLYLGRLHPKKNLANLLRAWKQALNSHPSMTENWVLAVVGWDQAGHERMLKHLADELGLSFLDASDPRSVGTTATTGSTSVAFLSPQFGADKSECYRACDTFILPSFSEGLPMTVLEAWAHAKPVLMTPECNLPEGFAAGAALQIGTGPEEIAAGLKQLTEMSDDDRRAMGDRGRILVSTKFSWPQIGEQMRSVYEWVLGGGATPHTVRL